MSVKFQDYYETLGVPRTASKDEIQRAYRKLAKQYHPDVNKAPDAEKKFKQASEAYEVLSDKDKRQRYDSLGADYKAGQEFRPPPGWENVDFDAPGSGPGSGTGRRRRAGGPGAGAEFHFSGGDFSDFFEAFFGRGARRQHGGGANVEDMFENIGGRRSGKARARRTPTRGGDVEAQINITLEDACHGSAKDIALQPAAGEFSATGSRSLRVKIPPGVTDGSTIRLAGQGQPGENGAPAGDLLLRVKLTPHPRYEVVPGSADLTADVKITPWEAALGAKVDVPTLDGPVSLSIPPGASSGQKLRLRGKGMPTRGTKGGDRGDLFVRILIAVPKTLTDEERELFEKLKQASKFDPRG